MIFVAISVVFNAFVLLVLLVTFGGFVHISTTMAVYLSYGCVGVLAILGYTRIGTYIVSLFIPGRALIGREREKLEPLLSDVINNTNREYGTNYKMSDLKIKVTDDKVVNACAVGYSTIIVNRAAFSAFNDEQLRAILAHEMAHLYYRDSVRSIALIFSFIGTRITMVLYAAYAMFLTFFSKNAKNEPMAIASWIGVFILIVFLPVILLNMAGTKVFELLNLKMSRGNEYRADAFAASLGYKADMIGVLEVLDDITVHDSSFIGKLMATHPAPMQRIGALEDEAVARKKIGKLFVATPFSPDNIEHLSGNSEVIRLSVLVVIIGLIWGFYLVPSKEMSSSQSPYKHQVHKKI